MGQGGNCTRFRLRSSPLRLLSPYGHKRICSRRMLIRVRIGKDGRPAAPYRTGHKPLALVYSLGLHVGVVALLFLPSPVSSEAGVYHSVVVQLEKDHKLIYYDFRQELPEVSASNPTGKQTTPGP